MDIAVSSVSVSVPKKIVSSLQNLLYVYVTIKDGYILPEIW